jgi:peptidyl-dipeptidase Dcp
MLAQDAFRWFETHGGLTRENGQRFRDMVLSRGNTLDLAEMYRAFVGHDPDVEPMIEFYGLNGGAAATSGAPAAVPPPAAAAPTTQPQPQPKKGERGR